MNKFIFITLSLFALTVLASCDDGSIEKKDQTTTGGKVVKAEGTVTGLDTWPLHYNVAVAGFTESNATESMPYADISKIMTVDENGHASIVLSNIASGVTDIEVCTLNSLRQRIVTFSSLDISNEPEGDTIRYDFGTIDASMLAGIQTGIFNASCTACHGANGTSAAGLNLTDGHSYADLVNQHSTQLPEQYRVLPNDTANSVLWQVIYGNASASWPMNHADMLNKDRASGLLQMLADWIVNGAQN